MVPLLSEGALWEARLAFRGIVAGVLLPLSRPIKAGASSRTPKWAESTTRGEHCLCRICATSKLALGSKSADVAVDLWAICVRTARDLHAATGPRRSLGERRAGIRQPSIAGGLFIPTLCSHPAACRARPSIGSPTGTVPRRHARFLERNVIVQIGVQPGRHVRQLCPDSERFYKRLWCKFHHRHGRAVRRQEQRLVGGKSEGHAFVKLVPNEFVQGLGVLRARREGNAARPIPRLIRAILWV
jgi:hypothetical protein